MSNQEDMHNGRTMNRMVDEWNNRMLHESPQSLREKTLELIKLDRLLTKREKRNEHRRI